MRKQIISAALLAESLFRSIGTVSRTRFALLTALITSFALSDVHRLPAQEVPTVIGQPTNLTSSVGGMISHKFQEHMWITDDGIIHLLTNIGGVSNSLQLNSSTDAVSWKKQLNIANSRNDSQASGTLVGSTLYIVFPNTDSQLELVVLDYVAQDRKWTTRGQFRITKGRKILYDRPSIAVDSLQRIWVAATKSKNDIFGLSLFVLLGAKQDPIHVGDFGSLNSMDKHSAALFDTIDGTVMVYTDQPDPAVNQSTMNFCYRLNSDPLDAAWSPPQTIYPFVNSDNDRYNAHWNAAVDLSGDVHIAGRSNDQLIYAKLADYAVANGTPKLLTDSPIQPYVQVSISELNDVHIIFPYRQAGKRAEIFSSFDEGESFIHDYDLLYEPKDPLGERRLEVPSLFGNILPVVEQYSSDNETFHLAGFQIAY